MCGCSSMTMNVRRKRTRLSVSVTASRHPSSCCLSCSMASLLSVAPRKVGWCVCCYVCVCTSIYLCASNTQDVIWLHITHLSRSPPAAPPPRRGPSCPKHQQKKQRGVNNSAQSTPHQSTHPQAVLYALERVRLRLHAAQRGALDLQRHRHLALRLLQPLVLLLERLLLCRG